MTKLMILLSLLTPQLPFSWGEWYILVLVRTGAPVIFLIAAVVAPAAFVIILVILLLFWWQWRWNFYVCLEIVSRDYKVFAMKIRQTMNFWNVVINGQNFVSGEQNSSDGRRFVVYVCVRRENTFLFNATWTWTNFIARWMTWIPSLCILWLYRDCSTDERTIGQTTRGMLQFAVNRMLFNIRDCRAVKLNLRTTILKVGLEDYRLIFET